MVCADDSKIRYEAVKGRQCFRDDRIAYQKLNFVIVIQLTTYINYHVIYV